MLEAAGLTVKYPIAGGMELTALDAVDFALVPGETHALVGESGCGKTTLAKCLLKLVKPTSGSILFEGTDLDGMDKAGVAAFRRAVQLIFQDPYGSLNPRMKVGEIVGEPLAIHSLCARGERKSKVGDLLERVGLQREMAERWPRQFSGGQRQRIGIARALAVGPRYLVADEPVSALDVSVQAQVLNLLMDIKAERGLAMLFISHDLRVVRAISDRVTVMYLGRIVETAPAETFFAGPRHPYSRMLLESVPEPDPTARHTDVVLSGDPPSPVNRPTGCAFHPRCPVAIEICRNIVPEPRTFAASAKAACHLVPQVD